MLRRREGVQLEQEVIAAKQKLSSAMRALPAEPVKDYTLTHAQRLAGELG